MTDLDDRLAADAARRDADEPALLDFEEAFDLATHDQQHARTRRSALRWAAAAAAVVVVAGVAAALTWTSPGTGGTGAGGARTLRLGGHTYVQQVVPADAAARDAVHPRSLDVFVLSLTGNADVRCDRVRPTAVLVAQSATTVTIRASVFRVPTTGGYYCGFSSSGSPYHVVALTLAAPLAGRTVVNESDGSAVGLLDPADLPEPTSVPPGYRAAGARRTDPANGTLQATRSYTRGGNSLTVDVAPTQVVAGFGGAPDAIVRIGPYRAEVRHDADRRCVVWFPRPGITHDVCSTGPTLLDQAALVAVARSLR